METQITAFPRIWGNTKETIFIPLRKTQHLTVNYDKNQPNSQFVSQKLYYIKTLKTKN